MGACTMGMLRVLPFVLLMGVSALAQSPTYGVGRTPSAEEIRAWDISIGPTGAELPPGRGTAKEGAQLYRAEGVRGMPREDGDGGHGSHFERQKLTQSLTPGNGGEYCRSARRSRRRYGITSIAPCLSIERGR